MGSFLSCPSFQHLEVTNPGWLASPIRPLPFALAAVNQKEKVS